MGSLQLSVILPLADHRSLAETSARAWAGQSLDSRCFEVVAVADGRERHTTERVRQALRPADRVLTLPGHSEIELYQAGADAARGRTLLFTEAHCVPAPDAARELLHWLEATGAEAAMLRSGHLERRGLAALEARVNHQTAAERAPERWWGGVSLRGFAVKRSLFEAIGGFRRELERYAETAFAIELDRRACA